MAWLPDDFTHPERVELGTGHHLRPIRESDVDIDFPAVMGSRERLWVKYGEAWGWPPATMTLEQDRDDLAHHEAETELLGCVYIDPPGSQAPADAVVSWWVVDRMVDSDLDRELGEFVPRWLDDAWGFRAVDYSP
jgi:hypothetical protein